MKARKQQHGKNANAIIQARDIAKKRITSARDLVEAGLVPESARTLHQRVEQVYALGLSPQVQNTIQNADPADPVWRQYVPSVEELSFLP